MITRLFLLFLVLTATTVLPAQDEAQPLTNAERAEVVDSIATIIEANYVFSDVGEEMAALIRKNLKEGVYSGITVPEGFADQLTEDLQSISNDLHLRVRFDPRGIAEFSAQVTPEDSIAFMERERAAARRENYGFQEVKILDGNIGYLNLRGFFYVTDEAGRAAESAMNFLANCDALIIDLRQNGGGSPAMIQLITSYLFGDEPVHLNTFYYRPQDAYSQTWTLPYVPGRRMPDTDVYVLTSSRTFSAAEEFSYNLRNLERATLVGETTGGGAHPGGTRIATERFTVWVPSGRAINPITETNWEGTGVDPHIEVPAAEALLTAQMKALENLQAAADEESAFRYEWALTSLQAELEPANPATAVLKSYAGNYGPRTLTFEDGTLYYQRRGRDKHALIPMTDNLFRIDEIPYFRLRVEMEKGKAVGLTGLYDNGTTDHSPRDGQP